MKIVGVGKLASWKSYFDKINEEYAVTLKKKQALSSLISSGKISQSTFDLFNKEMDEAIAEIERQKSVLLDKMNTKIKELEEHIKVLERLLANFEIQHVGGEIEEELYQREIALLSIGIETARQELDSMKEAVKKIMNVPQVSESVAVHEETETKLPESSESVEAAQLEVAEVVKTETQELNEATQETVIPVESPSPEAPAAETPPLETSQVENPPEDVNKES